MSWDDPTTDMAHCTWCSWDLYKDNAVDGMHADCKVKAQQRAKLLDLLRPVLHKLGIEKVNYNNLLTDLCRRIEKEQS